MPKLNDDYDRDRQVGLGSVCGSVLLKWHEAAKADKRSFKNWAINALTEAANSQLANAKKSETMRQKRNTGKAA